VANSIKTSPGKNDFATWKSCMVLHTIFYLIEILTKNKIPFAVGCNLSKSKDHSINNNLFERYNL
jgi:hypothetical protein